jgi:hypothetical protein
VKTVSILCVGLMAFVMPESGGQDSSSAAKAATLTRLMDQQKLDSVAAHDPEQPDRFVAALYYPGVQLLVVSASYPVPDVLRQKITGRQYRDVYMDLQSSATQQGRFFVMDLEANGVRQTRQEDAAFDVTYKDGDNPASFDGEWKRQNMSRAQYDARFRSDDERYTKMLTALERELMRPSMPAAVVRKDRR